VPPLEENLRDKPSFHSEPIEAFLTTAQDTHFKKDYSRRMSSPTGNGLSVIGCVRATTEGNLKKRALELGREGGNCTRGTLLSEHR